MMIRSTVNGLSSEWYIMLREFLPLHLVENTWNGALQRELCGR